jgi:hypothetical protein
VSGDFPAAWRYVPLKLTGDRTKWVNAIPYRKIQEANGFDDFTGVDVNGDCHFGKDVVRGKGHSLLKDGIEAISKRDGYGVGIFMATCRPRLVIVDCDTDVETVVEDGTASFKMRRGRDQLITLFERHGEEIPPCPVVRGNRDGHGYLIFRQNRDYPVSTRKIRPFKLSLDVLGAGHQNHWTCGNRELVAGRELLLEPPELPTWFAQLIGKHSKPRVEVKKGSLDIDGTDPWNSMFREAVLRDVTPHGPGWNQALFNAGCTLAENGVAWERLVDLIIERCEPETPTDAMVAMNSLASAWRKVTGEAVPE